MKIKDTDIV
jgi:hypothetical protein